MDVSVTFDLDAHTVVVKPSGAVDGNSDSGFRAALVEAVRSGMPIVLDLGEVTFIDSAGLGLLLSAHRQARATGQSLALIDVDARVDRVLRVSGLDRLLHVVRKVQAPAPAPESTMP